MRVLVTGHKGYIGVHLVDLLKQHGHTVTGVDLDLFAGCAWEPCTAADRELIAETADAARLASLERDWTGVDRSVDHAFWATQADADPFVIIDGGEIAGGLASR